MQQPGSYDHPETEPVEARVSPGAWTDNRPWETDSLPMARGEPLWMGVVAACAAVGLSLADMALLYSPAGGYADAGYGFLADVPRWRLLVGHYLGLLLLPLYLPGYWLVYRGLRRAGQRRAAAVLGLAGSMVVLGAGFHALVAPMTVAVRQPDAAALVAAARPFTEPLHLLVNLLLAAASLLFAFAVAGGRSRFPRWLAAANPLLVGLVLVLPYLLAPRSLLALLALPASFNLAHLVFFTLVTWSLRHPPGPEP